MIINATNRNIPKYKIMLFSIRKGWNKLGALFNIISLSINKVAKTGKETKEINSKIKCTKFSTYPDRF